MEYNKFVNSHAITHTRKCTQTHTHMCTETHIKHTAHPPTHTAHTSHTPNTHMHTHTTTHIHCRTLITLASLPNGQQILSPDWSSQGAPDWLSFHIQYLSQGNSKSKSDKKRWSLVILPIIGLVIGQKQHNIFKTRRAVSGVSLCMYERALVWLGRTGPAPAPLSIYETQGAHARRTRHNWLRKTIVSGTSLVMLWESCLYSTNVWKYRLLTALHLVVAFRGRK